MGCLVCLVCYFFGVSCDIWICVSCDLVAFGTSGKFAFLGWVFRV